MASSSGASRNQPDVAAVLKKAADGFGWRLGAERRWIVSGVGAALALGAIWLLWGGGGSGSVVNYVTEKATRSDITVIVTATGSVEPTNQVEISSELSGTIRKVLVDYNSRVKVGDVLAELDTDKLEASVESARAKLAAAQAQVRQAQATVREAELEYQRQAKLVERKVASQQTLDVARAAHERSLAALESARADVIAAEADLRLNETNLQKTCICSPINGVVLSRDVEPGQTVASSLQAPELFTIAEDLTQMEVQVDVDEADVGKVAEGQQATFMVDAYPGRTFSAEIRELRFGSEIVSGVVTYKAVLTTDNAELLLRPGMTATAEIIVQQVEDALTVPNSALRFTPPADDAETEGGSIVQALVSGRPPRPQQVSSNDDDYGDRSVWVLEDGTPKRIPVRTGPTDGARTVILEGEIETGLAVIVDTESSGG